MQQVLLDNIKTRPIYRRAKQIQVQRKKDSTTKILTSLQTKLQRDNRRKEFETARRLKFFTDAFFSVYYSLKTSGSFQWESGF